MANPGEDPDDDVLLDLAMAIADGTPVDWSTTSGVGNAGTPLRGAFERLQLIVRSHQEIAALPDPGSDTLLTEARQVSRNSEDLSVHWGPLLVFEKIGRGSFGDVYRARDTRLARDVALKLVTTPSDDAAEATFQEGRLLARVRHPNVVTVFGAERIGHRVGMWMEYVRGRTLAEEVAERGVMSPIEAARIGVNIFSALAAVHEAGLLHRDVKAANVMRGHDDRIVLGDFGTGLPVDGGGLAGEVPIAGTPLYLAPEILVGRPPTVATDIYSTGVLLYFLVSGMYPATGRTLADITRAHQAGQRTLLRTLRPELPREFVQIVDDLIEAGPDRRYGTAAAAAAALERWLSDQHVGLRRTRVRRYLAAAAALFVIGTGAVWLNLDAPLRARIFGTAIGGPPISRLISDHPCSSAPSNDGQWIACIEDNSHVRARGAEPPGPVVVFNPHTGEVRTVKTPDPGERLFAARISPDGQSVAFVSGRRVPQPDANGQVKTVALPLQLREVAAAGGNPRTILEFPAQVSAVAINEWSSTDQKLIVRLLRTDRTQAAAVVDPRGGTIGVIHEFGTAAPQGFARSGDARYLAYDVLQAPDRAERDIRVCELATGQCTTPVAHPTFDFSPAWMPDGRLLFASDRSGTNGIWAVDLDGLEAQSAPELVRDTGRGVPRVQGFGPNSLAFYSVQSGQFDIYSADLPTRPSTLTPVRLSPRAVDANRSPVWSPDGQSLAYVSRRGPFGETGSMRLVIQDQRDRREQEYILDIPPNMTRLCWAPDGRTLALRTILNGTFGVHLFDVHTGKVLGVLRRQAPDRPPSVEEQIIDIAWSTPQEITFASVRGVHAFHVQAGTERDLWIAPKGAWVHGMSLDPAGSGAALILSDDPAPSVFSWFALVTTDLRGGPARELMRVGRPEILWMQTWSPAGIFITRRVWNPALPRPAQLLLVSPDGIASNVAVPMENMDELRLHPDGTRVAFTANAAKTEFWMGTLR